MNLHNAPLYKVILTSILFSSLPFISFAQKLPNKQAISLRAPADIKIDGKTTEWNNKFQAYNNATEVFYTVSSDDENIYFTVMSKSQLITDKILRGGISITVNSALRKKEDGAVTITFPSEESGSMTQVSNLLRTKKWVESDGDKKVNKSTDDINNLLSKKLRLISVAGVQSITDKAISVENNVGIKAAAQFDSSIGYVYELAVPLKYFTLNNIDKLNYHLKLNGPRDFSTAQMPSPPIAGSDELRPPPPPDRRWVSATDFWGVYTLAKK